MSDDEQRQESESSSEFHDNERTPAVSIRPADPRPKPSIFRPWLMSGVIGKIIGFAGLLAFLLLCAVAAVFSLKLIGIVDIQWGGPGYPGIVWASNRATPDHDAVEADRRKQAALPTNHLVFHDDSPWPGFRGAMRDGVCLEIIRTDWDKREPKALWTQPSGGGHSSFAVARGRAFTLEQRRANEAVVAYHVETGRELWKHEYTAEFNDSWKMGDIGPRSTPAWDDGHVYSLGAEGHLFCMAEENGEVLWEKNILSLAENSNLDFGMAASPLVEGGLLIVPAGNGRDSLLALDKATGNVAWKSAAGKGAYTSPMTAELAGVKQILITGAAGLKGISLDDGAVLWSFPWKVSHDNNIAQPVIIDGHRVFISAGYGKGCAMLNVKNNDSRWSVEELWRNRFMKNKFSSSVYLDGHLYGLDDTVLACLDAETGKRRWKGDRYGYGQLLLADGHLVIVSGEKGDLALVKALPDEPVEVARISALGARTWNHPVIVNGRLLIRNARTMACYDISPSAEPVRQ